MYPCMYTQVSSASSPSTLASIAYVPMHIHTGELGFFPQHIGLNCKADDHQALSLPYNCSIDHYLDPAALGASAFKHRERSFLENPRTPSLANAMTRVRVCGAPHAGEGSGGCPRREGEVEGQVEGEVSVPAGLTLSGLVHRLGAFGHAAKGRLLHVDDVRQLVGGFDSQAESKTYHDELQALLSSWCCTSDPRFKQLAGTVPYILPPLPPPPPRAQDPPATRGEPPAWRGLPRLRWAASALAEGMVEAGEHEAARLLSGGGGGRLELLSGGGGGRPPCEQGAGKAQGQGQGQGRGRRWRRRHAGDGACS